MVKSAEIGRGAGAGQLTPAERGPRAVRTRTAAMHVVYGLLSFWALLQAQGVAQLLAGAVPARLHFALACATVFKLLSLGGALVLAVGGGRSAAAAQWLLAGQLAWFVAGPGRARAGRARRAGHREESAW